jgi:hypothetical protein
MSSDLYKVDWSSGPFAPAYITGPGVEALRLDPTANLDVDAIAEALAAAYKAGQESR